MGALEGLRVLDLSRVLAGPLCTMMLGDLGADVVKVEHPRGDDTRQWGPPYAGEHATYYLAANRNKRSVALDLTVAADRAAAVALAGQADVVVHNLRSSSLQRFELDEDRLRASHPALITCALTGYGSGPGADRPGYDFLAQAEGGLMSVTGTHGPTKVGVALSDVLMGLHATIGILAAVAHRAATGQGQHVEVDLLSSTLASLVNQASGWLDAGVVPGPAGNAHPSIAPYQVLRTMDGQLAVAVGNDGQFGRLCTALGRPQLADDPRFATNPARVRAREELTGQLEAVLRTATTQHWQQALAAADVPVGRINDLPEAFELARQLGLDPTTTMTMADGTRTAQVVNPVRMSATPVTYRSAPPALDEHGQQLRAGRWTDPGGVA